jgi:hypothetical protein
VSTDLTPAAQAAGVVLRPRVHPNAVLAVRPDGRWLITAPTGRTCIRVGQAEARVVSLLDGRTLDEVAVRSGQSLSFVSEVVRRAEEARLLLTDHEPTSARIDIQTYWYILIRLVDPARFFARLAKIVPTWLVGPGTGLAALYGIGAIVVAATSSPRSSWHSLAARPAASLATFVAVAVLSTLLHEGAHGYALAAQGGRVGGSGITIMCFVPLPHCDVTGAWAIPSRVGRLVVALAGPATNLALVGVAVVLPLDRTLTSLVVAWNAPATAYNLLPFFRLDGYYALAFWLDGDHLIRQTQRALAAMLVRSGPRPCLTPAVRGFLIGALLLLVIAASLAVAVSLAGAGVLRRPT